MCSGWRAEEQGQPRSRNRQRRTSRKIRRSGRSTRRRGRTGDGEEREEEEEEEEKEEEEDTGKVPKGVFFLLSFERINDTAWSLSHWVKQENKCVDFEEDVSEGTIDLDTISL